MTTTTAQREVAVSTSSTQPKSQLFCVSCDFESPTLDGEWLVTERTVGDTHRVVYECPECWQTVLSQPVLC